MKLTKEEILIAISETVSMAEAAKKFNVNYKTFRAYCAKLGVWQPNRKLTGVARHSVPRISLTEILEGLHPTFQTNKLRIRLLSEGIFKPVCTNCQLTEWLGKPIPLQLDHINGVNDDHRLSNLRLLCPNCHAQTDTWCGKNKKKSSVCG